MRRKFIKLLRLLLNHFSGFVSWLLSLMVVYPWTYKLPIIPEEYDQEAKMAILIVIFGLIFNKCIEYLDKQTATVKCVYSMVQNNFSSDSDLQVSFRDQYAKLYLQISLSGYSQNFKGKKIYLKFPIQVDLAHIADYKDFYKINDKEKILEIDLSKGFNANKNNRISDKFVIGVNLLSNQEVIDSALETEISDTHIDFKYNSVYFKGEE